MARKPHIQYRNLLQLLDADPALTTADLDVLSGTTASAAEINYLDTSAVGTVTASKVVTVDADKTVQGIVRHVDVSASGAAITAAHSGNIFTNEGATGTQSWLLPAATLGLEYTFMVMAAFELRIDPNGTETAALPSSGAQGAAGKYLTADAVGEWGKLVCVKAGQWQVTGYLGTWAHEG